MLHNIDKSDNTQPKIFCIGLPKTRTTSIGAVFKLFNFKTVLGLHLIDDWSNRDFRSLIALCQTAQAFQDIPFSLPFTYQILDYVFPNSKFILTVRNGVNEWYKSLTTFHTNLIGKGWRLNHSNDDSKATNVISIK